MGLSLSLLLSAWEEILHHRFFSLAYYNLGSFTTSKNTNHVVLRSNSFSQNPSDDHHSDSDASITMTNSIDHHHHRNIKTYISENPIKLEKQFSFNTNNNDNNLVKKKDGGVLPHKPMPTLSLPDPAILFSPKPVSELDAAAVKLQKVYKSYRTRRNLADCAVVVEELWWKALDFAALKRSSVSFFNIEKQETAVSRWARARTRAAKVGKGLSKDEKAQKLALQHWLEAIDPRHRYGHNLHMYYDIWFDSESSQPFFYWLDVGDGKEVNLEKCPRNVLHRQCIKYLGPRIRRDLWAEISRLSEVISCPWVVCGDFNAILGSHESKGASLPSNSSCQDFLHMISDSALTELPHSGVNLTWRGKRSNGWVFRKLDRMLCNSLWLDFWAISSYHVHPRFCSDHCPLVLHCSRTLSSGPFLTRFHTMWFSHPSFLQVVKSAWDTPIRSSSALVIIQQKLRLLKQSLKLWNRDVFGNVHSRVTEAESILISIQQSMDGQDVTEELLQREKDAIVSLAEASSVQRQFWKDKVKENWLLEGDVGSRFFHNYVRAHRNRNTISTLEIDGEVISDQSVISDHICSFYSTLYSDQNSSGIGSLDVETIIHRMVTVSENNALTAIPSVEEVKQAVFSMDQNSSPGPDGFPGMFFCKCWDIVGPDVVLAVRQFFLESWLPENFNCSFITLIPKVDGASKVTQFRPIALSNFVFKIIPKIIAERLKPIASRIVSPHQAAFIQGRSIFDCIGLVSEGAQLVKNKVRDGNLGIKLDISKAFDTMRWDFIVQVLRCFGFSNCFLAWIIVLLRSAKLSVLVNGSPRGFFGCSRGVRQGDPLSPLLFVLAEDVLSRGLVQLFDSGQVQRMSHPVGCLSPTHTLYADDIFIFCRGDSSSLSHLLRFLDDYGSVSGQIVSRDKSQFFAGNLPRSRIMGIKRILRFREGSFPFTYLGVPIFMGAPKVAVLRPIADKIKVRIASWRGKILSYAGRGQLIRSILESSLMHSFRVYKWPSCLLKKLRGWCCNFLWAGDGDRSKHVIVSWAKVCRPFDSGGLGIRDFVALNKALNLKFAWDSFSGSSPWSVYFRGRFRLSAHAAVSTYRCSSIWPGVKRVLGVFFDHARWVVGNGLQVHLWKDKWMDRSLEEILNHRVPDGLKASVSEILSDTGWCLPRSLVDKFPSVVGLFHRVALPIRSETDYLVWDSSSSGILSLQDAYSLFISRTSCNPFLGLIWRRFIPPKYSFLVWRIFHNRLPTDDNLRGCGSTIVSGCLLCDNVCCAETTHHLFFECDFAVAIWSWLARCFGRPNLASSMVSFCNMVLGLHKSSQIDNMWLVGCLSVFRVVWKVRNEQRFNNKAPSVLRALSIIHADLRILFRHCPGTASSALDRDILSFLGIPPSFMKPPRILQVLWHPPPMNWIKVNTDGLAKGNPGPSACGGVFRDHAGRFILGFGMRLGTLTSFMSELYGVINALEIANSRGFSHLWLESDSAAVISCFSSGSWRPPWRLHSRWLKLLSYIQSINFRCSHIYREGNFLADKLANLSLQHPTEMTLIEWASVPRDGLKYFHDNLLGFPIYRFC